MFYWNEYILKKGFRERLSEKSTNAPPLIVDFTKKVIFSIKKVILPVSVKNKRKSDGVAGYYGILDKRWQDYTIEKASEKWYNGYGAGKIEKRRTKKWEKRIGLEQGDRKSVV